MWIEARVISCVSKGKDMFEIEYIRDDIKDPVFKHCNFRNSNLGYLQIGDEIQATIQEYHFE